VTRINSSRIILRPLEDFASALAGEYPLFLVGGQAVNIWALYYKECTEEFQPFVSHDADILGKRDDLAAIAKNAGVKAQYFPMRPPTNEIGVALVKNVDGSELPIQVLSSVHGISNEELLHPAYTIGIGGNNIRIRVPGPVALLQAKIANFADIPQQGRQDGRHVLILSRLMPAYLKDLDSSFKAGRITEKDMLDLMEHLLKISTTPKARKVFKKLEIQALPMFSEIKASPGSKIHLFLTKRLHRKLEKE
jgi:hypothetical protein